MEGTRLRILQLLQKTGNDTVDGLATTIGLAPATIRRHLDILQRDRLVTFEEVRKKTGRPEYSFHLTEQGHEALPKSYDMLLGSVIQGVAELTAEDTRGRDGSQILELLFQRLSEEVWSRHEDEVNGQSLEFRLNALTTLLSEQEFSPEAEVTDERLRIRLLNCPFRSVALQNDAVCSLDANLISAMLAVDMEREECIQDGDAGCMYTAHVSPDEAKKLSPATERVP